MSAAGRHNPPRRPVAPRAIGPLGVGAAITATLLCAQATAETLPSNADPTHALLQGLGVALIVALVGTAGLIAVLIRRERLRPTGEHKIQGVAARSSAATRVGLFGMPWRKAHKAEVASLTAGASSTSGEIATGAAFIEADMGGESPSTGISSAVGSDHLDTTIAARHCTDCDRIFDIGAEFCPYDGHTLHPREDFTSHPEQHDTEMVCPTCAQEHEPGTAWCPDDHARLVPKDPRALAHATIGIVFCSSCQSEFLPEHHTCPHDGHPLLPMLGRRTCGLPGTGIGPKRRICPECGTRHAADTEFCSQDGHGLVNMN